MKSVLVTVALLVSMAVLASGQPPKPIVKPHKATFDWLFEGTQELGLTDRISVTKALTRKERAALIVAITAQYKFGNGVWNVNLQTELDDDVAGTLVKLIDLNGDGISEVFAQASSNKFCSPTGNCDFWVFMRSGNGYRLILNRGAVQMFGISSKRTNGFNDLILRQHGSAFESDYRVYRFANGKYRLGPCYYVSYLRLVGDEVQELKEPDVTPCKR